MSLRPDQAEAAARRVARRDDGRDRLRHAGRHATAAASPPTTTTRGWTPCCGSAMPTAPPRQLPYVSPARSAGLRRAAVDPPGRRRREPRPGGDGRPRLSLQPQPRAAARRARSRKRSRCSPRARRSSATPFDPTAWVDEHLNVARLAGAGSAQQIALRASEAFPERGGDRRRAVQAARRLHLADVARRHPRAVGPRQRQRRRAAVLPLRRRRQDPADPLEGLLLGRPRRALRRQPWPRPTATTRWPRPIPSTSTASSRSSSSAARPRRWRPCPPRRPTPAQRAAFLATPLAQAIATFPSAGYTWQTKRKFYTQIASQARDASEMALVAELARDLSLPELAGGRRPHRAREGPRRVHRDRLPDRPHTARRRLDDGPRDRPAGKRVRRLPHQPRRRAGPDAADARHRARAGRQDRRRLHVGLADAATRSTT